jgi:hypothetical protein
VVGEHWCVLLQQRVALLCLLLARTPNPCLLSLLPHPDVTNTLAAAPSSPPPILPVQVLFYSHADPSQGLVSQREYMGGISQVFLNATHAALLLDGRLLVHPIVPPPGQSPDELDASLPPPGVRDPIACAALSQHFAVTGSSSGLLCYYLAQGLAPVNEYKHSCEWPWCSRCICVFVTAMDNWHDRVKHVPPCPVLVPGLGPTSATSSCTRLSLSWWVAWQ